MISNQYNALDRALVLDGMGYVCTTATTLDTTVKETKPVLDDQKKPMRDGQGEIKKELGPVVKEAKTAIGTWADAEPGEDATKRRFLKQLNRIKKASREYMLNQDENNIGVAIITSKSGIVVLDIDAGKVPEVDHPDQMMNAEVAHDLLLERLLKVSGVPEANICNLTYQFRQLVHVRTPSGGWHYYFRRRTPQKPRTHTGLISHVDIRAGFRNEEGDWESSGLAYAPGNVTTKGEYIIFQVDVDGHPSRLKSLPPVNELPFLPEKLNSLFEKSTTEIREIAAAMAIPVPKTNEHYFRLRDKTFSRSMVDTDADLSKWDDLAREFIQKAFELCEGSHEC